MGESAESIIVTIGGTQYSIRTDVDEETAKKIAEYVDSKINELRENSKIKDELKLTLLTALNIAGELYEYRIRYEETLKQLNEIKEKTVNINKKLDNLT